MSKYKIPLEQHIMNCWNVVDDLKSVHSAHRNRKKMSADEMSNVFIGLEHLYRVKFEALFECFEKHLMEEFLEVSRLKEENKRLTKKK